MAITSAPIDIHWNYFLSIEADLIRLARYIEFHEDNYETYSLENTRILIAAAAEIDVVCKQICKQIDSVSTADNIFKYRNEILPKYPIFAQFEVVMPRYGLSLKPWDNWNSDQSPYWWDAYNNMKHHRDTHYSEANLKNVLNAAAGLFIACLYLYKDKAEGVDRKEKGKDAHFNTYPSIFLPAKERIKDWFIGGNGYLYKLD